MSENTIESQERIVIMIDPSTKKAELFNMTSCKRVEVDGQVDIQPNEQGEMVVKIDASFTLKGLICKFEKPANQGPEEQQK